MYIVVPTLYELQSTPLCYNKACIRSIKTDRDQGHLKQQGRPVVVAASQWDEFKFKCHLVCHERKERTGLVPNPSQGDYNFLVSNAGHGL